MSLRCDKSKLLLLPDEVYSILSQPFSFRWWHVLNHHFHRAVVVPFFFFCCSQGNARQATCNRQPQTAGCTNGLTCYLLVGSIIDNFKRRRLRTLIVRRTKKKLLFFFLLASLNYFGIQ